MLEQLPRDGIRGKAMTIIVDGEKLEAFFGLEGDKWLYITMDMSEPGSIFLHTLSVTGDRLANWIEEDNPGWEVVSNAANIPFSMTSNGATNYVAEEEDPEEEMNREKADIDWKRSHGE